MPRYSRTAVLPVGRRWALPVATHRQLISHPLALTALADLVPRLRALAAERGAPVVLEASGIAPTELRAYAATGIDLLSSSAPITRSPWLDLSMRFTADWA